MMSILSYIVWRFGKEIWMGWQNESVQICGQSTKLYRTHRTGSYTRSRNFVIAILSMKWETTVIHSAHLLKYKKYTDPIDKQAVHEWNDEKFLKKRRTSFSIKGREIGLACAFTTPAAGRGVLSPSFNGTDPYPQGSLTYRIEFELSITQYNRNEKMSSKKRHMQ